MKKNNKICSIISSLTFSMIMVSNIYAATIEVADIEPQTSSHQFLQFTHEQKSVFAEMVPGILDEAFTRYFAEESESLPELPDLLRFLASKRQAIAMECAARGYMNEREALSFGQPKPSEGTFSGTGVSSERDPLFRDSLSSLMRKEDNSFNRQTFIYQKALPPVSTGFSNSLMMDYLKQKERRPYFMERATHDSAAFHYLVASNHPDLFMESCQKVLMKTGPKSMRACLFDEELGMRAIKRRLQFDSGELIDIGGLYQLCRMRDSGFSIGSGFYLGDILNGCSLLIAHAPTENIQPLITQAGLFFNMALQWDSAGDQKLFLNDIARFFFFQTHAMPYVRGSESITKWVIELLARKHRMNLVYSSEFEARMPFAMEESTFIDYCDQHLELHFINPTDAIIAEPVVSI